MTIAELGSFRAAARKLGMSPSALSHSVRELEAKLAVRLFNRTTRSVALTEAGQRLVHSAAPAISSLDDAIQDIVSGGTRPSGRLRITSPDGAASFLVREVLPDFQHDYPDIQIEIVTDKRMVDIVSEGFDAGIRFRDAIPKDMIAIRLGPVARAAVVGAPDYVKSHPLPEEPMDLMAHNCICLKFDNGRPYKWELSKGNEAVELDVSGQLTVTDMSVAVDAALAGLGLAFVPEALVTDHIASGRLIRVLAEWTPAIDGFWMYYPQNRHPPSALRAFVQAVQLHSRGSEGFV
ncbi:LysR family transcriptional regulator [Rhizobium sp. 2MFCol3.1]|uniref:LysR family transcriptional regulator n=1 Tax=Rhizobium sp. 2MFCol3.1 TaxID=1246459 RepID=UPI0018C9F915|nr:LysR family transcriptional regulator [Rhizobium sp. 2MFCol3.1]